MAVKNPAMQGPIVGVAHGVQQRSEQGESTSEIVCTFRIDRYDESGNLLQPVPVQMRGRSLEGFINEGDQVELPLNVSNAWQPGKLVRAARVRDVTTGAMVEVKTSQFPAWLGFIILAIFAVVFIGFGLTFVTAPPIVPLPVKIGAMLFSLIPTILLIGLATTALWKRSRGES